MSTPETLVAKLDQLVRHEQREKRMPSLAAGVLRDGELVWETAIGLAEVEWLANFAARRGTPVPEATTAELWRLYALSRVNETMLLRFQTGPFGNTPLGWAFLVAAALPLVIGRGWRLGWSVRAWFVALAAWGVLLAD